MAYSATPSGFFGAGYALASSQIKLNTNTNGGTKLVTECTDAESDATTGDWRKIIYGLSEMIFDKWNAVATADRPTKVSISKSTSINTATDVATVAYSFVFTCDSSVTDVSAE